MPRFFAQEDLEDCPIVAVHTSLPPVGTAYRCGCVTARYVADDIFETRLAIKCGHARCELWPYYYCSRPCLNVNECVLDDCPFDPPSVKWDLAHPRCIGCKRFIRRSANWNQCPDCDTRTPEDY
jgi:hypothetical protein